MSQDIIIACVDCKKDFEWTVGEQDYYRTKRYMPPKRCSGCRESRKKTLEDNRNKDIVQTRYSSECDKCGKSTTVPFKPDKTKGPIYCKECFRDMKQDGRRR